MRFMVREKTRCFDKDFIPALINILLIFPKFNINEYPHNYTQFHFDAEICILGNVYVVSCF